MDLDISQTSLPVYKALASEVRLKIIDLLSTRNMSVQGLSSELGISSSIVLMHLNKLADANIIKFRYRGHRKLSILNIDNIHISFPKKVYPDFSSYTVRVPVGQYTGYAVKPSCGLAGEHNFIGKVDQPTYFMDPKRVNAQMIWWNNGYVEYQFPKYFENINHVEMLDISAELGSEFPFSNNAWPSDISVFINDKEIGFWTSPGDFSDTRGKFTPDWVPDNVNQYGILKTFRVTNHGSYLDGQPLSDISLKDIKNESDTITIRFQIKNSAKHKGGCTIFGAGFGNYPQDIEMKVFYSKKDQTA